VILLPQQFEAAEQMANNERLNCINGRRLHAYAGASHDSPSSSVSCCGQQVYNALHSILHPSSSLSSGSDRSAPWNSGRRRARYKLHRGTAAAHAMEDCWRRRRTSLNEDCILDLTEPLSYRLHVKIIINELN
jgi:hypothetical protein